VAQLIKLQEEKRSFYKPNLNLGARLTLSIGGSVLLVSIALFAWLYHLQEEQAMRQVETQAQALLSEMMVVRDWVSEYGDVWTTEPGELHVEGRDGFYRKSPGMVTKEISLIANAREDYRFHITSLKLKNPDNIPDEFELTALHQFEENPSTVTSIEEIDGRRYFRQMIPLHTQATCLECHSGYQIGDIRGGISVLVPMDEVDASLATGRQALIGTAVFIVLLIMGLLYWLVRRMVAQPLAQLRGAALAMGQGDFQTNCNLQTGDELQALGETFNQMADNLQTYQNSLHEQIDRSASELDALSEMALTISSGNDLEPVLGEALAQALQATAMSGGIIRLKNTPNQEAQIIHHGFSTEMAVCVNQVIANENCALWDLHGDSRTIDLATEWLAHCDQLQFLLREQDYRRALIVPLRSGNRTVGTLTLLQKGETAVSPEQVRFVGCLGNQLGVAVENAHFQAEIERLAILEERGRIARDLHDSLAQTLSWLHLKMDVLTQSLDGGDMPKIRQEASDVQQVVGQACLEVRESIDDLRQAPGNGLAEAVSTQVDEFSRLNGQNVNLVVSDTCCLSSEAETEAAFILQEALTNIRKHASAQRVDIHIQRQNGHIKLSVRDNGQGFDPQDVQEESQFGLQIMRERAARVGGTLQVHTTPGSGTQIIATFPVETAVTQPVPASNGHQK
jgi:two-component system nitrate/nitrite sensor histidine kinase NarX